MRFAMFDPFCGVAGNMVLGALIDCGLDAASLEDMLRRMDLPRWRLGVRRVERGGLRGTLVDVAVPEERETRHLEDIVRIISGSDLPDTVVEGSLGAFRKLASAESEAHGITVDEVHFHETGGMDAILDITGAFCGLHLLGIERVYSSPVATGTGTVECAHGVLPVPSPATLRILEGIPTVPTGIGAELATPTGAAILAGAVGSWSETPPPCIPVASGYGAGSRELRRANLLRVTVGETVSRREAAQMDGCVEIRTVIDDLDPRIWPQVSSGIMEEGALDCYTAMCIGRKGRPAQELTVICSDPSIEKVINRIFRETTTLGVRVGRFQRVILERDMHRVSTPYGSISVKRAYIGGALLRAEPEYDDCARAAAEHGVPVREVLMSARMAAERDKVSR